MADRRRRRALEDEGEENSEKENVAKGRPSECESEGEPAETGDLASEYESAAEDNRDAGADEDSEEGSEEETEEETEEGSEEEEDEDEEEEEYTDDDVIIEGEEQIEEERQSGDGEEQPDKENVDDDEDKKNPAYVPRKGAFYEHDLRTGEEDNEEVQKPKKKLWQDEGKWAHDRFREDLQAPKSREELMALYGYDIRAADKPPDAPPPRLRGRGRGRPQRRSKLSDFMEPKETPPPPQPEAPPPQRMVVIDTTDTGQKPKTRSQPPPPPPPPREEVFEDFDEEIEVPYMTTIDTTQSSADSYQPRGQRRRGAGPRQRRDRQSFEEKQNRNSYQSENYQERKFNRERQTYGDRTGGRQGGYRSQNPGSQDARFSQPQDARLSPQRDLYSHDYPALSHRTGGAPAPERYSQNSRAPRSQEDIRSRNSRNMQDEAEVEHDQRNSFNYSQRGSSRGGFPKPGRGRERNDRNNRPPRYSRMEREERHNISHDLVPAKREFTNSSFRAAPSNENSAGAENSAQEVDKGVEKDNDRQTSQDVVISNKENVQTISVTITNTTMERKSYAKDRRGKSGSSVMGPGGDLMGVEDPSVATPMIEAPPRQPASRGDQGDKRYQRGAGPRQDSEQNRPKRYSSQRQRNMIEYGYGDPHQQQAAPPPPPPQQQQQLQQKQKQVQQQQQQQQQSAPKKTMPVDSGSSFYNQVFPPGHPPAPMFHPEMSGATRPPPPPQDPAAFSTAMLQSPMPFHLPVSGPGMPSPPRLMGPNMAAAPPGTVAVPISNASPQLLPAPYMAAPTVIYSAPPPPPGASPPYQVPLGYTSPPPAAPPPTLAQPPVVTPQSQPEVHRGGTVYFPPYLQQPSSRSPARRQKVAIPIVDPTELKKKSAVGSATPTPEGLVQDSSEKGLEGREKAAVSIKPETKPEPAAIDPRKPLNADTTTTSPVVPKPEDGKKNTRVPDDSSFKVIDVPNVIPVEVTPTTGGASLQPSTSDTREPTSSAVKSNIAQVADRLASESEAAESPPSSSHADQNSVPISETVTNS
ncbi:uncharacterized protein LOC143292858 isoform X2 [Babylonia areolata]|uniref:uncharacterized protein LOC143292858 isoform X2 n=1 Tax=Babylonia areolata TaxID=304850 RepID=UPI003FD241E5